MVRPAHLDGVLERHRSERADVLDGDLLQAGLGVQGQGQRAVQYRLAQVMLYQFCMKNAGRKYRVGQPALVNMLLDLPLALEMGQAGLAVGADHRGVNKVLHAGCLGGVGQVFP